MRQTGLSNRVALITGGATGIGLELARQLRLRNNEVVICGLWMASRFCNKLAARDLLVASSGASKASGGG